MVQKSNKDSLKKFFRLTQSDVKKLFISLGIVAISFAVLFGIGILSFIYLGFPGSMVPNTHTIKNFDDEMEQQISDTYQLTLSKDAKIKTFKEQQNSNETWYILEIYKIKSTSEFMDNNPIIAKIMEVKEGNGKSKPETVKPTLFYNKDKIYIYTYYTGNQKLGRFQEYCTSIENLFKTLQKAK